MNTHIVIVGHGRSGTNLVLDLFDCHRNTFCRNEPNELIGTPFTRLGDPMFLDERPDEFEQTLRAALQRTFHFNGVRDRFRYEKDYFHSPMHAWVGQFVMSRTKLRKLALAGMRYRDGEEWPCPEIYYKPQALRNARPVLKILLSPAWTIAAHRHIPEQRVVHVLRQPKGFIQSWWNRYVTRAGCTPEGIFQQNRPSLARILHHFGRETEMPKDYSLANLITSELWRWRYLNEVMIADMSTSSRYLRVSYQRGIDDRLRLAEQLYTFADLDMTPYSRNSIQAMRNTLFGGGKGKSNHINPMLIEDAVQQVVSDSPYKAQLLNDVT